MRRNSLFFRLVWGNLLVVAIIMVVAGAVSLRQLEDRFDETQRNRQEAVAQLAREFLECLGRDLLSDPDALDQFAKQAIPNALPAGTRVTIIAPDGTVLGESSGVFPERMVNHRTDGRPEILGALDGRPTWDVRPSETLGVPFRYFALPVRETGKVVAVLRVATPVEALVRSEGFIWRSLVLAAGVAIALAALLAMMVNWVWYRPLRQISEAAGALADGALDEPVRLAGARSAELEALAASLNDMRTSLAARIRELAEQGAVFQAVVSTLAEGVISTDPDGTVTIVNPAAEDALHARAEQVVGSPVQRAVRAAAVLDLFEQVRDTGQADRQRVDFDRDGQRRVLDVRITPMADENGAALGYLLVFRDITDIVRAAEMKAEFVVNAGHEFRTPLATIRAAVEALADVDPADREDHDRCLGMLDRHVARLEDITSDLLSLHRLESGGRRSVRREDIPLGDLLTEVERQLGPRARDKGVDLELACDHPQILAWSDRRLLDMILLNLVENALKFTPSEGTVSCRVEGEGGLTIRVADTGCGIAPADQVKVFDRFYQADPSRSGDGRVRGTGLGLAIVKHAVELLEGTIHLESEIGKGATITVTFPARRQG